MEIVDHYRNDEIDDVCLYYGQFPDNLPYNMKVMLVEKYEKENK